MTSVEPAGRGIPVLCLIDGSALVYRSHYAFIRNPLINSKGENVSAVFGFVTSVMDLLDRFEPKYVAVVFDTPEPTFRHEIFEDYKATREAAPEEMIEQLPTIRRIMDALGIPVVESPGYEADDVIGTLAVRAHAIDVHTTIISGDKDFFQLVGDDVSIYDPGKKIQYDSDRVVEQFGVPPGQVIEVLGLMGDSSDNVPGVPGIGKKTAVDLIRSYGTIEGVLKNLDSVSGTKRRENLDTYRDQALESRVLVTIELNAPVDAGMEDLSTGPIDVERATELFRELEFPSLLKRLPAAKTGSGELEYGLVKSLQELDQLVVELAAAGAFAIDLETTSLDPILAKIVGVSVSSAVGEGRYIPVRKKGSAGVQTRSLLKRLGPLLEDAGIRKCGQNLKYDYEVLRVHGVEMRGIEFDTMLASYLLDPGKRRHNLAALALEHLGRNVTPIESLIGKGANQLSFADVDVDVAGDYACEDAEVAYALTKELRPKLFDAGLTALMTDVEMPLLRVLAHMELEGVALDTGILRELGDRFGKTINELRAEVHQLSGVEFNIDSPKQVSEVLFERLELPRGRRTKTGYSTDNRVLSALSHEHGIARLILSYRQLTKLKSGYIDALPRLVNEKTGRVHTSFNQAVAATGRLSSSNPNLQNIPTRTELGREIRKAFVAKDGSVLMSADYSQIELRIMAHISNDESMKAAFEAGKDLHRATAALVFEKGEDGVEPSERDWAKTVNFGIMYGMSSFGLARQLGISNGEAAAFIDRYFESYPGVLEYTERVKQEGLETGYVSTLLGRRRRVPGLDSENGRIRSMAERVAVNTPIQGSAADMIKVAMIGLAGRIEREKLPCALVLQVHDELVLEVETRAIDEVAAIVREEMTGPKGLELSVPVVVDIGHGRNWFEAH
jgi:DNA polymerase-1